MKKFKPEELEHTKENIAFMRRARKTEVRIAANKDGKYADEAVEAAQQKIQMIDGWLAMMN